MHNVWKTETETPAQHNPYHVLHQFLYHVLPIQPPTKIIGHTIPQYMLMSVSLIHCHCRFLYIQTSWYFLWFKYNHQKAESWRAASLSKLGNNSLIFNKGIFHFPAPWLSYNHLYNTHQIPFFTVTISHLQFHLTICLTIPSILTNAPFISSLYLFM